MNEFSFYAPNRALMTIRFLHLTTGCSSHKVAVKTSQGEGLAELREWREGVEIYFSADAHTVATATVVRFHKDPLDWEQGRRHAIRKLAFAFGIDRPTRAAIWEAYFASKHLIEDPKQEVATHG